MITIEKQTAGYIDNQVAIRFYFQESDAYEQLPKTYRDFFDASYLSSQWFIETDKQPILMIGCGKVLTERLRLKELAAKATSQLIKAKQFGGKVDVGELISRHGIEAILDLTEGFYLGNYQQVKFSKAEKQVVEIVLTGIREVDRDKAEEYVKLQRSICEGITFARNMTNLPANKLRPLDLAKQIKDFVSTVKVETELLDEARLIELGMHALLGVGQSSEYPPCMLVLRYKGNQESEQTLGLIGKGVTVDTGGYCLKPAASMKGIKGDMAGGAAVVGSIYALAKNQCKVNVTALIPMCENRIAAGSLVPGDVIGSFSGKTIEIGNTDAEGRVILADAVSYAVQKEQVTKILDIATLTGAVVSMLGFSCAGVICDDDLLYKQFESGYQMSGERYLRLPFYQEHEEMIKSDIADIRNISNAGSGTITAGLFIRDFTKGIPWIHLDIAGTAWSEKPIFAFQSSGATGAGVSTMYYFAEGIFS